MFFFVICSSSECLPYSALIIALVNDLLTPNSHLRSYVCTLSYYLCLFSIFPLEKLDNRNLNIEDWNMRWKITKYGRSLQDLAEY